jgi:hypothetical protein
MELPVPGLFPEREPQDTSWRKNYHESNMSDIIPGRKSEPRFTLQSDAESRMGMTLFIIQVRRENSAELQCA